MDLTKLIGSDVVILSHYVRITGNLEAIRDCNGKAVFQVSFVGQPNETVCVRFDELAVSQVDGFTIYLL